MESPLNKNQQLKLKITSNQNNFSSTKEAYKSIHLFKFLFVYIFLINWLSSLHQFMRQKEETKLVLSTNINIHLIDTIRMHNTPRQGQAKTRKLEPKIKFSFWLIQLRFSMPSHQIKETDHVVTDWICREQM